IVYNGERTVLPDIAMRGRSRIVPGITHRRFLAAGLALAFWISVAPAQPPSDEVAALKKRGSEALASFDYPAAIAAYRQLIPLAHQLGDTLLVARCYRSIGACLYDQQDAAAALESYR